MSRKICVLFASLVGLSHAAAVDKACEDRFVSRVQKKIPVPDDINYFLRASINTREVVFATSKGNRLLNVETEEITKVPGDIDPVLSPDGKILSVPMNWTLDPRSGALSKPDSKPTEYIIKQGVVWGCPDRKGCFPFSQLSRADLEKKGVPFDIELVTYYGRTKDGWQVLLTDPQASANYQSIGILKNTGEETVYRTLYESNGVIYSRDYRSKDGKLSPANEPRHACKDKKLFIPMIGKKADDIFVYDPIEAKSYLVSIGEDGRSCNIRDEIPSLVGKADFNSDGSRVAYHVDHRVPDMGMKRPDRRNDLEAMIFDRKTKTQIPIVNPHREDSYYPVFIDDKTIVFVSATKTEKESDKKAFFINTMSLEGLTPPTCADCYRAETRRGQLAALLGQLRLNRCRPDEERWATFRTALASFSQLTAAGCKELADRCDPNCMSDLAKTVAKSRKRGTGMIVGGIPRQPHDLWDHDKIKSIRQSQLIEFCRSLSNVAAEPSKKPTGFVD